MDLRVGSIQSTRTEMGAAPIPESEKRGPTRALLAPEADSAAVEFDASTSGIPRTPET
ncbi:hypothetical protein GCM10009799_44150 [Nocardiopsis rhodophaea]|uniref:Uncharacterized protein n=1 Tax=Nocardiopsis rhodophaea TaxID=280238 RepID=A0ABP5F1L5_9ACTN